MGVCWKVTGISAQPKRACVSWPCVHQCSSRRAPVRVRKLPAPRCAPVRVHSQVCTSARILPGVHQCAYTPRCAPVRVYLSNARMLLQGAYAAPVRWPSSRSNCACTSVPLAPVCRLHQCAACTSVPLCVYAEMQPVQRKDRVNAGVGGWYMGPFPGPKGRCACASGKRCRLDTRSSPNRHGSKPAYRLCR